MKDGIKKVLTLAAAVMTMASAGAQIKLQSPNGDLQFRLIGRTNLDLGTYLGADDDRPNRNGASVNDTRLGLIANFEETWQAKIEISFANKAISFRDVYVQKSWDGGHRKLQIGNVFMPYGVKIMGLAYKFIETSTTDLMFTPSRKMGALYQVYRPKVNFQLGFFSDGDVDSKQTNQGWQAAGQGILHIIEFNKEEEGASALDLGASLVFTHPSKNVAFNASMPTTINSNVLLSSGSMEAYNYGRIEAKMLFIKKRFYAEAHYHQANVNTPEAVNADNFKASGFYAQMSWLLKGNQQNYNPATGLAAHPAPKSLEVLARFNTTKIEDASLNDVSAEMNYFISKYLVARVLYVHTMVKDGPTLDLIQGRLQFSF